MSVENLGAVLAGQRFSYILEITCQKGSLLMSSFIAFIVPVIMLCVYVGINLYLSYGIYRGLRRCFPRLSPGLVIAFFLLMAVVLILGFVRSMLPIPSVLRNALGVVSSYWMGLFVYLLLFTLFSDIVYIMIKWFSPDFCLRAYFTLAAVVMALATSVYGVWHSNDFQHVTYDVTIASDEQMEDTKLVLISDLHLGAVGSENRLEGIVS